MTRVPLPVSITTKISQDAVKNARIAMGGYGWSEKSIQALQGMPGQGVAGIRTSQKYLMHQERGIRPFLMTWVNGRTLALGCKMGDGPHFRRGGHVGEPGMVNIPHVGQVFRQERWKHPGLAPRNFMKDALTKAVADNQPMIKAWINSLLRGGQ
jgi:hypothetical protein